MMRIAIVAFLCFSLPCRAAAQRSPVDTLRWLSGCWEGTRGNSVVEEMWMAPRAGVMLGVGRTSNGGRLRDAEFVRIFARGDTLVYAPGPLNQPSAEFRATSLESGRVVFEDLRHDFPKRIAYRRSGADSLVAYIEGETEGERRVVFTYARMACTG
jgi:hypothetical protein